MPIIEERKLSQIKQAPLVHNIIIENRSKVSISGVEDVESFDEKEVVLHTCMGVLIIKGEKLHINKLNVDSGEVIVEGNITSCLYAEQEMVSKNGGFLTRLFK